MALTNHTFELNGSTFDMAANGIDVLSVEHTFGEGAKLRMRFSDQHYNAPLSPGDTVSYRADGTLRFLGQVQSFARQANERADEIQITALDARARAASVSIAVAGSGHTVGERLAAGLREAGYNVGSGFDQLDDLADSITFRGTLDQLISSLMQKHPQYRLIVDPSSGVEVWHAVQVYPGTPRLVSWGGSASQQSDLHGRVKALNLEESTQGTYTAVVVEASRQSGQTRPVNKSVTLGSAWSTNSESSWHIGKIGQVGELDVPEPDESNSPDALVYRAFFLPDSVDDFDPKRDWSLRVKIPKNRREAVTGDLYVSIDAEFAEKVVQDGTTVNGNPRYVKKRFIVAKHPVTVKGDARVPGQAKGPTEAVLAYEAELGGSNQFASVRVPATGYEGSAFNKYGVTATKYHKAQDPSDVDEDWAQRILDTVKDVRTSGDVTLYGSMPDWAWPGGNNLNVVGLDDTDALVNTDYDTLDVLQTGWRVNFEQQTYMLQVTDDRSRFVETDR